MTFLAIVQNSCLRVGLASPNVAYTSTDENVKRMVALANAEGEDLANIYRWQRLCNESTFTSVATESQGAITTLAGASFNYLASDTVWNRTKKRAMAPCSDIEWQAMMANSVTGPYERFRIRGNTFRVIPTMAAGDTVAFEWYSKNFCQSSGGTGQSAWAADEDTGVLDEGLMTLGLIWRWKAVQGLDYSEDFETYSVRVANASSRDGAKKRLVLSHSRNFRLLSNYNVQEGSFT